MEELVQKWKERASVEFSFLKEDGLTDSDALDTMIGKIVGSVPHVAPADVFPPGDVENLMVLMDGRLDYADAVRILRVKREITALRERGMDHPAIVKELLKRIHRPAGYKRVGRPGSSTPSTPAKPRQCAEARQPTSTVWSFNFSQAPAHDDQPEKRQRTQTS